MAESNCTFHFDIPHPHQNLVSGCQFRAERQLFSCGGRCYCRFHLPLTDDKGQPTKKEADTHSFNPDRFNQAIYALIDRARMNDSPVDLTGVVFPGDFQFQNKTFPEVLLYCALFPGHANFKGTQFTGDADFKDVRFMGDALFEGAQFTGDARFTGTMFTSDALFDDARFTSVALFDGAQFRGDAGFKSAKFKGDARFHDARFAGDTVFDSTEFTNAVLFDGAQFRGDAGFKSARFKGDVRFHDARFAGDTVFDSTEFTNAALFDSAQFTGGARFQRVQYTGAASFKRAQFTGDAVFENAQFTDNVRFDEARFECETLFENTQFTKDASFERAKFTSVTLFNSAQFTGNARFKGAQFMAAASFHDAQFTGGASFKDAQFEHDADFSTSNPSSISHGTARRGKGQEQRTVPHASFRYLDFSGGNVNGVADFSDRIFTRAADFSGRTFGKAPLFHGSDIHQGTNWHDAEFRSHDGHDAEMSYRTLRLAMEEIRDRPQEAIFFSHEQKTRRGNLKWWKPEGLVSGVYQLTSGYGRSIVRPAFAWLLISSVFLLICWWWTGQPMNASAFAALGKFTLLQIVKPFSVWGEIHVDFTVLFQGGIPAKFQLLATLYSTLSLIFIALLILALRWLFKRG